jgi:hypothetical protein
MCNINYPIISVRDGITTITFPATRPYTKEIIDIMESKGYSLCGGQDILSLGENRQFDHRGLSFRPKRMEE